LPLVDVAKDAVLGNWHLERGNLHVESTPEFTKRVTIPLMPQGEYQLRIVFTTSGSNNDIAVMLPVGIASTVLVLDGDGDHVSGFALINGKDVSENETSRQIGFARDSPHTLVATVRVESGQAAISANLDRRPVLAWRGPTTMLAPHASWQTLYPQALGIGSQSTAAFHDVAIRMFKDPAYRLERESWSNPIATLKARGFNVVVDERGQVERLESDGLRIVDFELEHLSAFPRLRWLGIGWNNAISDKGMAHIAKLRRLTNLHLVGTVVTDEGFRQLKTLTRLEQLDLYCSRITNEGLRHLAASHQELVDLCLSWSRITDAGLVHLKQLPSLRRLNLGQLPISDTGVEQLGGLANLEDVRFHYCRQLSDRSLETIAKLPRLQTLFLDGCNITDAGLIRLKVIHQLQELGLLSTKITNQGLANLVAMKQLQKLDVRETSVSDQGLQYLGRLESLRELRLRKTNVSDAGLVHLTRLKHLRQLDLSDTRVTIQGVEVLKAALPNCTITFDRVMVQGHLRTEQKNDRSP
jgi:hypothetical protein